ncbi:MAG: SIMPL domain-containing protein, partial [Candidatus Margulisbacteria bacterium]|nr:SIMPL domain-containing protein [Candidatus Margulisiibacteriota bacterium]
MKKNILIILLTLILALPTLAIGKLDQQTIIVTGQGNITASPDIAYLTIGVEKDDNKAEAAQEKAAETMNQVLSILAAFKIPKDKIETSNFRLWARYEYNSGKRKLEGYTVGNEVKVTIDNLSLVSKCIDSTIAAGASEVRNITFTVKDNTAYKNEALKKAFNEAKEKAKSIAAASGLKLVRIANIQENEACVSPIFQPAMKFKAEGVGSGGTPT